MNEQANALHEVFTAEEGLAPDSGAVYARVQELSQKYRRRRRGAQVAGGAVLGAGLIAAAVNLPALLPAASQQGNAAPAYAAGAPAPASAPASVAASAPAGVPSVSPVDTQRYLDKYFSAGYDLSEAQKLAKLWNMKDDDLLDVKAKAGRLLLAGESLPVKPPNVDTGSTREERAVNEFFRAGYTIKDAAKLSKIWHTKDAYAAKVRGGEKLLAGHSLPIKP
ncbi:hypothetical protein [Krasilnikovia sp. MM14-A1259]|uniref:hypothetical protein n=1 Tax=Krasilnikovia sp. MM14-A1259 TaxID=3373539 RepID=UPI00382595FA